MEPAQLEAAVNEADKLDLLDLSPARRALDRDAGQPGGLRAAARFLTGRTFRFTDSELERSFLPLVRRVRFPAAGDRPDVRASESIFSGPTSDLSMETDGLRYHRTPAQQARDRLRDQSHTAAGLTPLRFTHAQIRFE